MNLKVVIIDDEKLAIELIHTMVNKFCCQIEIVGETDNITDGIALCKSLNPDVLFLDIELCGSSGFDFFDHFKKPKFQVVLISAESKYAIKAIKHRAFDFILKPISLEDLNHTMERLIEFKSSVDEQYANISLYFEQRVVLPQYNGFKMTCLNNIIRLEANNNYTYIYTISGERIVVSKTLKEFGLNLHCKWFVRIHKSHIINLHHIKDFVSDTNSYALMADGFKAAISKSKQHEFNETIREFIG
jgi:two-component system, LytTR family, response regulator